MQRHRAVASRTCVLLCVLLLLLLTLATACAARSSTDVGDGDDGVDAFTEMLYVSGCGTTSTPLRHTTGCFARHVAPPQQHHDDGSSGDNNTTTTVPSSVTLSIGGVHFPIATSSSPLRVCLDEHIAPPLPLPLGNDADTTAAADDNEDSDTKASNDAVERALRAASATTAAASHDGRHTVDEAATAVGAQSIAATASRTDCVYECVHVTPSTLLPTQLLRCQLPHPSTVLRAAHVRRQVHTHGDKTTGKHNSRNSSSGGSGDEEAGDDVLGRPTNKALQQRIAAAVALLHRMRRAPVWMDVRLQKGHAHDYHHHRHHRHGQADKTAAAHTWRTVALLRRAVRIDLAHATSDGAGDEDGDGTQSQQQRSGHNKDVENGSTPRRGVDVRRHSLEQLYSPTASSQSRRGGNNSSESEDDDVWFAMGVGGLKAELRLLFRRVFLDRLPSLTALTSQLQVQHVRGVILHGPPGNGKTLIARRLVQLLGGGHGGHNVRVTLLSATDVLSKYVGESEKNLRDAFLALHDDEDDEDEREHEEHEHEHDEDDEDDEDDAAVSDKGRSSRRDGDADAQRQRTRADKQTAASTTAAAPLHVLVIDELDALFHRRGFSSDESSAKAVYDGVTNTLLSLMDGIHARNDVLVIGLTNRLYAIDAALLRPGRFEVVIEIPQPDAAARAEICLLHTATLRHGNMLADDVDCDALAQHSEGFSGADVAGAVRAAVSRALLRYRDALAMTANTTATSSSSSSSSFAGFAVTMDDLRVAVEEIRGARDAGAVLTHFPAETRAGVFAPTLASSSASTTTAAALLVDHDSTLTGSLRRARDVVRAVQHSSTMTSGVVWVTGARGNGKTLVAQRIAEQVTGAATTTTTSTTLLRYVSCRQLCDAAGALDGSSSSSTGGGEYAGEPLAQLRRVLSDASRAPLGVVVIDDADVLFDQLLYGGCGGSGGAAAERAVRNMLYAFVHNAHGVAPASSTAAGGGVVVDDAPVASDDGNVLSSSLLHRRPVPRRLLVLTSTSREAAPGGVMYDAHVHVHSLHRSSVQRLLAHYDIVHEDANRSTSSNMVQAIARHYPVSLSFRSFMRITNMALWRLEQRQQQQQQRNETTTTTTNATARIADVATARRYMRALDAVVASMGLTDPFRASYRAADDVSEQHSGRTDAARSHRDHGKSEADEHEEDGDDDGDGDSVEEGTNTDDEAAYHTAAAASELLW